MPTIPASIIAKLRSSHASARWDIILGPIDPFAAGCCDIDSDTIMGVSKQPVIVADFNDTIFCLGDIFTWDLTASYAPSSTLTSYTINVGDGTPSYVTDTGSHTYASVGSYTVTITIAEGGGLSQTKEYEVNVVDCSDTDSVAYQYAIANPTGVWFTEWGSGASWSQRADGLSDGKWWLVDNFIFDGEALGIYKAVDADSKVASLINLADPGTNDLTEEVAIAWTAALGWDFSGGNVYLSSPITLTSIYTVIVVMSYVANRTGSLYGSEKAGASHYIDMSPGINPNIGTSVYALGNLTSGNIPYSMPLSGWTSFIFSGSNVYSMDPGDASPTLDYAFSGHTFGTPEQFFIGCRNDGAGSPTDYFNAKIAAVLVYDRPLFSAETTTLMSQVFDVLDDNYDDRNSLIANHIAQVPSTLHLTSNYHELWLATQGGIYFSPNGGRGWQKEAMPEPSNSEYSDAPAHTENELEYDWVLFDPNNSDVLYAGARIKADNRSWVYKRSASGVWTSRGMVI